MILFTKKKKYCNYLCDAIYGQDGRCRMNLPFFDDHSKDGHYDEKKDAHHHENKTGHHHENKTDHHDEKKDDKYYCFYKNATTTVVPLH